MGYGSWHNALPKLQKLSAVELKHSYPKLNLRDLEAHVKQAGRKHDERRAARASATTLPLPVEAIRLSSAPMRGATCRRPTIQRDPDTRQSHLQAVIKRRKAPGGTPGSLRFSREAALGQSLEAP